MINIPFRLRRPCLGILLHNTLAFLQTFVPNTCSSVIVFVLANLDILLLVFIFHPLLIVFFSVIFSVPSVFFASLI